MRDFFGGRVMITLIILSLLTAFILIGWFVARRRKRTGRSGDSIPLFVVPSTSPAQIPRPPAATGVPPRTTTRATHDRGTPGRSETAEERAANFSAASAPIRTRDAAVSTLSVSSPAGDFADDAPEPLGDAVDSPSIRYWRA